MADRQAAIATIEDSRRTHVEWLEYQEAEPRWAERYSESVGGPDHHRRCIAEYDNVLAVLRS